MTKEEIKDIKLLAKKETLLDFIDLLKYSKNKSELSILLFAISTLRKRLIDKDPDWEKEFPGIDDFFTLTGGGILDILGVKNSQDIQEIKELEKERS